MHRRSVRSARRRARGAQGFRRRTVSRVMIRRVANRIRPTTARWLRMGARTARRNDWETPIWDNRYALIERLAPGRSFLDLGGMFDVAGEVAFRAEAAGAT